MLDTRLQDVCRTMNVSEQEAAIDQVSFPIRVCRGENVDVSKREIRIPAPRDGAKLSGTFVAHDTRRFRHVTHQSGGRANAAAEIQRQLHAARHCAFEKTPGGWSKCGRQVFEPPGGEPVVAK